MRRACRKVVEKEYIPLWFYDRSHKNIINTAFPKMTNIISDIFMYDLFRLMITSAPKPPADNKQQTKLTFAKLSTNTASSSRNDDNPEPTVSSCSSSSVSTNQSSYPNLNTAFGEDNNFEVQLNDKLNENPGSIFEQWFGKGKFSSKHYLVSLGRLPYGSVQFN